MRLLVIGISSLMLIVASSWPASAQSCEAKCNSFCTKNYPHSTYCTGKCVENCNRKSGRH
jgi:hypothetical protein